MRKKMPRREFLKVAGTAVLVVSAAALTGCGDTPSGGNGGTGGSGGNNTPDNGNTGSGDSGNGGDSGTGSEDSGNTKPGKISYKDTRTAKYYAKHGITATNVYMEGTVTADWSGKLLIAKSGENVRFRKYFQGKVVDSNGNQKDAKTGWNVVVEGDTVYELNDKKQQYERYTDYYDTTEEKMKSAAQNFRNCDGYFIVPADNGDVKGIEITTCTVGAVEYYAEKIYIATETGDGWWNGRVMYHCFEGDDLKYIVQKQDGKQDTVLSFKELHQNTKPSITRIPADYTQVTGTCALSLDWEF